MTKYNFLSSIIFSVLLIAFVSCNEGKKSDNEETETEIIPEDIVEMRGDQIKLANIETGQIENRLLSSNLKVSGIVSVAPENFATVCMPLGGFIKSISLMPGNVVRKGQTLAILENQEFVDIQQKFIEAKNKLEYAEAEYQRHNELYKDDVYSQKNIQEVTADYKNLKAEVKALEQKLVLIGINPLNLNEDNINSSIALLSPISGFVKTVNVNIGKSVSPSDILFEIINSDRLLLELTLFEKDADKVSTGQKIRFYINNETEQHEAIIYQTGKSINTDKTFNVYASIPNTCKKVLPGMYVNAIIEVTGDTVTAVPSEAVVSFEDKNYIFVHDKDKQEDGQPFAEYRMIEVSKGISESGYTEIVLPKDFDTKNAKIVTKGAYNLLSAKKNAGEMAC
jgi:RND family efflux transporter MFP subunit